MMTIYPHVQHYGGAAIDTLCSHVELIVRHGAEINKYVCIFKHRKTRRKPQSVFCALMILWLYNRVSIFTTFSTSSSCRLHHLLLQIIVLVQVCISKTMVNWMGDGSCSE